MNTLKAQIAEHPFSQCLAPGHQELLLKNAKVMDFKEGEIIFREGEPANRFFLIESGRIVLEAHQVIGIDTQLHILEKGDVLGWSWLFPPFCWHFQARAIAPTRTIVLDGGHLLVTAESNHDFGYALIRRITQLVIARLQTCRHHMLEAQPAHVPL